jgi:multidrug efflux system membrane fusion protein
MVTTGNLVGQSEPTLLTTIVQMDPLHLVFEVPERDLLTYWGRSDTPSLASSETPPTSIRFGVDTDVGVPYEAVVDFRDSEVKPGTGTVLLRAVVPNSDRTLSPGMFAKVEVSFSQRATVPHLSESTVARDQQGHYVLTVTADNKVQRKSVKTGPSHNGLIAIREGLTETDHIIVSGSNKVSPGMSVTTEIVELNRLLVAQGDRP